MIYFDAYIVPDLAKGALLSWLLCPFNFPFIFEHKMFQVRLVFPLPQPWHQPFSPRSVGCF